MALTGGHARERHVGCQLKNALGSATRVFGATLIQLTGDEAIPWAEHGLHVQ